MNFYMYHGRYTPDGPPQEKDGTETEDWGFVGPTLEGVVGFHSTYGDLNVVFKDAQKWAAAQWQTGWASGVAEYSLQAMFSDDGDLIKCCPPNRNHDFHYFGDWGIK